MKGQIKLTTPNLDEKGFTLVELLVVIAIIGMLACLADSSSESRPSGGS